MIEKTEAQKKTEKLLLAGLEARRKKERRFVWLGRGAIALALFFLATLPFSPHIYLLYLLVLLFQYNIHLYERTSLNRHLAQWNQILVSQIT